MTAPSSETIASLERSLQNCSLNRSSEGNSGVSMSAISGVTENLANPNITLELNSEVPLPYKWEQFLDLETGEIYYVNWENGRKTRKDPRETARFDGDNYLEEDEYDSDDGSASSASPPFSCGSSRAVNGIEGDHVLVVAGCKRCLMYFMLPKHAVDCPKCNGLLLHFDSLENESL